MHNHIYFIYNVKPEENETVYLEKLIKARDMLVGFLKDKYTQPFNYAIDNVKDSNYELDSVELPLGKHRFSLNDLLELENKDSNLIAQVLVLSGFDVTERIVKTI